MPLPQSAQRITDWEFSPDDRLFFDTNIWMRLLELQGNPTDSDVAVYSSAYKRILQAKSVILTDSLILAEFANAALRVRHELAIRFSDAPINVKEYPESDLYPDDARAVCWHLTSMREQAQFLTVEPPNDWEALEDSLKTGERDFNDEMILLQCQRHNAILVTHDRDFINADVPILTHHWAYFRR